MKNGLKNSMFTTFSEVISGVSQGPNMFYCQQPDETLM